MLPQMMPLPWLFLAFLTLMAFFSVYAQNNYHTYPHFSLNINMKLSESSINW